MTMIAHNEMLGAELGLIRYICPDAATRNLYDWAAQAVTGTSRVTPLIDSIDKPHPGDAFAVRQGVLMLNKNDTTRANPRRECDLATGLDQLEKQVPGLLEPIPRVTLTGARLVLSSGRKGTGRHRIDVLFDPGTTTRLTQEGCAVIRAFGDITMATTVEAAVRQRKPRDHFPLAHLNTSEITMDTAKRFTRLVNQNVCGTRILLLPGLFIPDPRHTIRQQ